MQKLWQQLAIATNWPILAAIVVLSTFGVLSIYADSHPDGIKQSIYLAVAFGCMVAFQAADYITIARYAWPFYVTSLLIVAYTVLGSIADKLHHALPFVHNTKGVFAWINLGPISLEPSELVKIAFVLITANYLRYRSNYRTVRGLLPPFALALVPIVLILKQPDLGVAALFMPTLLAMLFVAGARVRHMVLVLMLGTLFLPIFWFAGPREDSHGNRDRSAEVPVLRYLPSLMREYQRDRVKAILVHDPHASGGSNYQQEHALMAFGSGGLGGKGLGQIPVGRHVPEAHNDMVFALIGEQFGIWGAALMLFAYFVLFWMGLEIAAATKEPLGRLVAVGVVAMLATQASINLMVCLQMMPVTGVTLPFVSYGGSSLVASFLAAGLLLNVGQNRPLVIGKEAFEFDET